MDNRFRLINWNAALDAISRKTDNHNSVLFKLSNKIFKVVGIKKVFCCVVSIYAQKKTGAATELDPILASNNFETDLEACWARIPAAMLGNRFLSNMVVVQLQQFACSGYLNLEHIML